MSRQEKLFVAVLALLLSLEAWAQAPVRFQSAVSYTVGTNPVAAEAADFNGDGKVDLAVINSGSNNVSILLGNGDGTFEAALNFDAGNSPSGIAIGDFNGDGKTDLAVFMRGDSASSLAGEV